VDSFIGTELDVHVTYDYTEDVTFGLGMGWFWSGDMYDDAQTEGTTSDNDYGAVNDTVKAVTSSVSVVF
jgi:hypothetical protein